MLISLTHKELKSLKRLGNALQHGVIEFDNIKALVTSLQQKVENVSAVSNGAKTSGVKGGRKNMYRTKLKIAV